MSGSTVELALKTAVDADDTADYLTLSLADSLRTVDALFNNTTGHTHSGAHQGGAITSIPAGAIGDGSITSAKIADGTIVAGDIADGTITSLKIAANATWKLLAVQQSAPTGSTTSTSAVAMPAPFNSIAITSLGGYSVLWALMAVIHSSNLGAGYISYQVDGGGYNTATSFTSPLANFAFSCSVLVPLGTLSAGAHTVGIGYQTNLGTLSMNTSIYSWVLIMEFLR